uniref:Reverse transcriptase zinc-binding domain-containing protein n=1 Tax=Cannabis sativa TaxID=3483 RepID=A0A803NHM6_CANSA
MTTADDRSMYLGLPSTMGRNKSAVLGYLKDRLRKKLQGWDSKVLSRAGKEVLIKVVAQAFPSYAMNVFLLPLEISRDIESSMAGFWWKGSNNGNKGIWWMSWDRMCLPKDNGGMGFRNLQDINLALLGKQGWRFLSKLDALATRIFKARYFPNGSYLSASLGSNSSYVWRSVWEAQSLVRTGVRWCIGDGSSINILNESWLPDPEFPFVSSTHPALENSNICNLLNVQGSDWDLEILHDLFDARDRQLILQIPLGITQTSDMVYWSMEATGVYTVKSGYKLQQRLKGRDREVNSTAFWKDLWSLKVPSKVKNLMWRACSNCLPMLVQLAIKKVAVNTVCPLCNRERESICHNLVLCSELKQVWDIVGIGTSQAAGGVFSTASAVSFLDQWRHAQNTPIETSWSSLQHHDGNEHWVKPQYNSIKINVDAALFEDHNRFGMSLVVCDHNGFLLQGRTRLFSGNVAAGIAEEMGFREALSWIKKQPICPIWIETNLPSFEECCQDANIVAHEFARASLLYSDCIVRIYRSKCLGFGSVKKVGSVCFIKNTDVRDHSSDVTGSMGSVFHVHPCKCNLPMVPRGSGAAGNVVNLLGSAGSVSEWKDLDKIVADDASDSDHQGYALVLRQQMRASSMGFHNPDLRSQREIYRSIVIHGNIYSSRLFVLDDIVVVGS